MESVDEKRSLDKLIKDNFEEVAVDKGLVRRLNLEEQGIPTFVAEWLIEREKRKIRSLDDEEISKNIQIFIKNHLPSKSQKQYVKNRLQNGERIKVLDKFGVKINLKKNEKEVVIPSIDEKGKINPTVVDKYEGLLEGGMWGAGELVYERPTTSTSGDGVVRLDKFKPLQAADVRLDYYRETRSQFSTEEWIRLLLRSMGYSPGFYQNEQTRIWLLTRLLPLVQKRVNLIELAPKGTGKSFIFSNFSRYSRVISGGKTSPAVLFYNKNTSKPGLLTQYDALVFDEAQTISFSNPDEVVGILKDYMESGKFTRGNKHASSDCGVVFLGNVEIGEDGLPAEQLLFNHLPEFLRKAAFVTRIHGILPGWQIPKIQNQSPTTANALKADFFSEILRRLRAEGDYDSYVSTHVALDGEGADNLRNNRAIKRLAAGYTRLFFPDLNPEPDEFEKYCLKPAISLRRRVCDQLQMIDPGEYDVVSIDGHFEKT